MIFGCLQEVRIPIFAKSCPNFRWLVSIYDRHCKDMCSARLECARDFRKRLLWPIDMLHDILSHYQVEALVEKSLMLQVLVAVTRNDGPKLRARVELTADVVKTLLA